MHTYLPDRVVVSHAGIVVRGFGPDTFVSVRQESDNWSDVVGVDGVVSRSRTNDRRATVEITLMQTSPSNDDLSALANLDINAVNGAGVGPFVIRDLSGRLLLKAGESWIQKPPDVEMGRAVGPRVWTIRLAKIERIDGGN